MKPWYTSRTLHMAIAQAIVGIIVALTADNPELTTAGWVIIIKSALDGYLRITTSDGIR